MSAHYYSPHPDVPEKRQRIQANINGSSFQFDTSGGVFSKKGVDFGSRLLIESITIKPEQQKILDVGTGYGVIGICLAKAYPFTQITLLDVNTRAVRLAEDNAELNGVKSQIVGKVSDGFQKVKGEDYDLIVCNPPIRAGKEIIYSLFQEAGNHLKDKGTLWLVIRKQQGAASAKSKLESLFSEVSVPIKKKGYWILKASNN